jgi:hypothetical protein
MNGDWWDGNGATEVVPVPSDGWWDGNGAAPPLPPGSAWRQDLIAVTWPRDRPRCGRRWIVEAPCHRALFRLPADDPWADQDMPNYPTVTMPRRGTNVTAAPAQVVCPTCAARSRASRWRDDGGGSRPHLPGGGTPPWEGGW